MSLNLEQNAINNQLKGSNDRSKKGYDPCLVQRLKRQIAISKRANSHKIASAIDKQK